MTVASSIELPDLGAGSGRVEIRVVASESVPSVPEGLLYDDGSSYSIRRDAGGCTVNYGGWAEFVISGDGTKIEVRSDAGTGALTVRHLLQDQVIPLALGLRGEIVLHASSVAVGPVAIAFLGSSGSGKSTLAAALAGLGVDVVADDALRVREAGEGFEVAVSYRGLRLWPDSADRVAADGRQIGRVSDYAEKIRWRVGDDDRVRSWYPLSDVFCLERVTGEEPVELAPLAGPDRFLSILANQFRLPVDMDGAASEFDGLTRLARSCRFWRLRYRSGYDELPGVARAIVDRVSQARQE